MEGDDDGRRTNEQTIRGNWPEEQELEASECIKTYRKRENWIEGDDYVTLLFFRLVLLSPLWLRTPCFI